MPRRPCQQRPAQWRPQASSSLATTASLSTTPPWRPEQQIHHGAPCQRLLQGASASNKPHPAEKSTPVWLAIWHIWAGLANSQLLPDAAALYSIQGPQRSGNSSAQTSASLHPPASLRLRVLPFTRGMVAHGLCGRVPDSAGNVSPWIASVHRIAAAQTDANLSTHLHRLPTPPPYLRRMRLSSGWGAGIRWVIRLSPGRMRRSCKSPRARILVLGTSGAHWPARWPRFELTERVAKS